MSVKCPRCGSTDVTGTNVGSRVVATTISFIASVPFAIFGPGPASKIAQNIDKNLCSEAKYICLKCKKEFKEMR